MKAAWLDFSFVYDWNDMEKTIYGVHTVHTCHTAAHEQDEPNLELNWIKTWDSYLPLFLGTVPISKQTGSA